LICLREQEVKCSITSDQQCSSRHSSNM
jgi:hypothetical protein